MLLMALGGLQRLLYLPFPEQIERSFAGKRFTFREEKDHGSPFVIGEKAAQAFLNSRQNPAGSKLPDWVVPFAVRCSPGDERLALAQVVDSLAGKAEDLGDFLGRDSAAFGNLEFFSRDSAAGQDDGFGLLLGNLVGTLWHEAIDHFFEKREDRRIQGPSFLDGLVNLRDRRPGAHSKRVKQEVQVVKVTYWIGLAVWNRIPCRAFVIRDP
jgi:hypothetical protein